VCDNIIYNACHNIICDRCRKASRGRGGAGDRCVRVRCSREGRAGRRIERRTRLAEGGHRQRGGERVRGGVG